MSQAELARRSGVPASTISSIISRNNDRVAIEMIMKLCEVLECDIEEYVNSFKKESVKQMPTLFSKKYYALDEFGRNTVNVVLEAEYERCIAVEDSVSVYRAAYSSNNHEDEIAEFSKERLQKLKDAPETDEEL